MAGNSALDFLPHFKHFATHAIHTGQKPEQWSSWAVVPPITLSTIFKQRVPGDEEVNAASTGPPSPAAAPAGGTGGGRSWAGHGAPGADVSPRGSSWANASISPGRERGSRPGRRRSLLTGPLWTHLPAIPCLCSGTALLSGDGTGGAAVVPSSLGLAVPAAGGDPERFVPRLPNALCDVCFLFPRQEYKYTRFGNPNRHVLEKVVSALDGAEYCLAYSSGMAAILNICHLLKTGDTIICMDEVYEGTRELFDKIRKEFDLTVVYVDCTKLKKLEEKIKEHPKTKLVWLESPTNPVLTVIDIRACAEVAHRHHGVLVAVDNSFMSPYFQRPLALGADICMSSATKYINGHSDVLLGLVSVNRDDLYERLNDLQKTLGAVPSPFDCYMCNRGLKTLHIRMKQHFHNGLAVAQFLESHPSVEKVIYPGLSSHPQYEVMKRQCTGVSGMVSFYINGTKGNAIAFLENLEVFTLGFSLGGFESLAEHPYTMTHGKMDPHTKERLGITETLIRLSVGLEDKEDLVRDLQQALEAAFA